MGGNVGMANEDLVFVGMDCDIECWVDASGVGTTRHQNTGAVDNSTMASPDIKRVLCSCKLDIEAGFDLA